MSALLELRPSWIDHRTPTISLDPSATDATARCPGSTCLVM
ncbi:hypothetical protein ACFW4X_14130 [Streptomyces smyrnaeus]